MSATNPPIGGSFTYPTYAKGIVISSLLQTFFTGLYSAMFLQALILLVRERKGYILACLTALYTTVIVNLAMQSRVLRFALPYPLIGEAPAAYGVIQYVVSALAAVIADSLLSWRCYIIWKRNKWILAISAMIISTEIILLPIWMANTNQVGLELGPHLSFIVLYWILSLVITTTSTTLIVYRIVSMARRSSKPTPYYPTIEILVESGAIYTILIVICCILWALSPPKSDNQYSIPIPGLYGAVYVASDIFYSLLIPVTGIAPTLITLRVASGRAREDAEWSQPITAIAFRSRSARGDVETLDNSPSSNVERSVLSRRRC